MQKVVEKWFERDEFRHFTKHDDFKVKCLKCGKLIDVKSCGITSLKAHLSSTKCDPSTATIFKKTTQKNILSIILPTSPLISTKNFDQIKRTLNLHI